MSMSLGPPKTVLLFGEVLLDIFPNGESVLGGAPFNVARHLKGLGFHPILVSRIGKDALADQVLQTMQHYQMDTVAIQSDPRHPTGQVQVVMQGQQHQFDILPDQAYDFINPNLTRMSCQLFRPSLAYFGTLAQRQTTSRSALRHFITSGSGDKFLDINLRSPWFDRETLVRSFELAQIVKLNRDELFLLAEMFELDTASEELVAQYLLEKYKLSHLVVTCGADGAWQFGPRGKVACETASEMQTNVVDTVGAGDAFAAAWIVGRLLAWSPALQLERAHRFAAAICGIRGATPNDPEFYVPFMHDWHLQS